MYFSRRITAIVLSAIICVSAFAQRDKQEAFVAIPPAQVSRYHIDFARYFFATPEAEKAERADLYATVTQLEALKGRVTKNAANLQHALELNDRVQIQLNRHYTYLYLRNAVNTLDEASLTEASNLDAEVTTRTAFLRQELMQLSE